MKIVVIGGTGLIGSKVVERLRKAGHEVVVAAPSTGVNILTGEGLDEAMAGTQVVVDLANSPVFVGDAVREFFEAAGQKVLGAEKKAGVGHHIALSVVGTDRLASSDYFRGKLAQERLIRESGIPYTIIHSTQFYEFLPGIIQSGDKDGSVHMPTALVQPIAAENVADAVASHAQQAPLNGTADIAGPERTSLAELAQRFLRITQDPREVVGDPSALYFGAQLQDDTLVPLGTAWQGEIGFEGWLRQSEFARYAPRE
ncbi:SDR family oxidoreductase [Lysobacter sp. FW306-1B-D06B]|uniref:SDR family oxidoreductase n=1 Tax=Lysobacter sp. FW306-1B-D06B TaxID=3140250 RepID=UPI0031405F9A